MKNSQIRNSSSLKEILYCETIIAMVKTMKMFGHLYRF